MRVWLENGGGKGRREFFVWRKLVRLGPIHGFDKADFVGADL